MNNLRNKMAAAIVFLMLLVSYNANAQKRTYQRVKAGYSYGMPELNLNYFAETKTKNSHGFYANYSVESRFAERFAYFLDLVYEQTHSEFTSTQPSASTKYINGNLNAALGLKFYPLYNLGVYAGVFGGFKIINKVDVSSETMNKTALSDLQSLMEDTFRKKIGGGYGLRFGADYRFVDDWFVDVLYSWGDNQKIENPKTGKPVGNYRLNYISAGIGYRF